MTPEHALAAAGISAETFTRPKERGRLVGKLRLLRPADALALPPRAYLVPGLIAPGELSVWWGAPKTGKSFIALRLAYGLALGRGIWGREPSGPVRVLYLAAEGEGGIGKRIRALRDAMGDAGDSFAYVAQRMELAHPGEHLADAIAAAAQEGAGLVVVDTVARVFGGGDENSAGDMGGFIKAMDRLREEGAARGKPLPHVAIIHHGPKDPNASTPRGSIALVAAADLVVKITKGADGEPRLATVTEAKDDADGYALPFTLRNAPLDCPDGDTEWTCIAEDQPPDAATGPATKRPKLPPSAQMGLRYLSDLLGEAGNKLPASNLFPDNPDLRCVELEAWRLACFDRNLSGSSMKRSQNLAFQRAREALELRG
ncbi:MAG: AAA family ATPase, partial [Alphaproteobacteria bacterium]|nr:AAA family ATPase [Alphaproteobacteria bacterium]